MVRSKERAEGGWRMSKEGERVGSRQYGEGRKGGRWEDRKDGRQQTGRMEGWKDGRKNGRLEGGKNGRAEEWKGIGSREYGVWRKEKEAERGELIDLAYESFCRNLEMLRKNFDIQTICMHGSPRSKFDNRLVRTKYDYWDLGIVGEPYFDIDFSEVLYLTDTGRRWDGDRFSVRDKVIADGRLKDWKGGRMEEKMEDWKDGRENREDWKDGRMEGWKGGRLESWKVGRLKDKLYGGMNGRGDLRAE